jgi:hypothetical protein
MRVQEDVAAGRLSMARQRLRGTDRLVPAAPWPARAAGRVTSTATTFLSQAGRWSFLSQSVNPEELRAFEREFADPVHRIRAIGWSGPVGAAGEVAQQRLAACVQEPGRRWAVPSPGRKTGVQTVGTWGGRLFAAVLILWLGLWW